MATIRKFEINTGFEYETYEYIWKLHNFGVAQERETGLVQQKFEMQVGRARNVQSKWLVGLKPPGIRLYFRLLEKVEDDSKISTRVSVHFGKDEKAQNFLSTVYNLTAQNEEFLIPTSWTGGVSPSAWNTSTDENGTFIIKIKFELLASQVQQTQNRAPFLQDLEKISIKRLCSNFSKLLENSDSQDVKIICNDGTEIAAHKVILSAQNTVFASMFESDLSENRTGVVNVKDVTGKAMKIILHYLYTGSLLPEWSQPDTIVEFMYAAGKYQLTEVLEMLDNVLGNDDGSTCNLVLLMNLANKLSLKNAETKLVERIIKLTNSAKSRNDLFSIFGNGC